MLFFAVTADLLAGGPLTRFDVVAANWLRAHGNPAATQLLLAVTHAHGQALLLVYAGLFAAWLAVRRDWAWVGATLLAVPGGLLLNHALKLLFERARPKWDDPLLTLSTYSFPSGHAAGATLLYGLLAAYFIPRSRKRAALIASAVFFIALVGLSRLYLGVHYLSDVLAAVCSSAAWLVLCLAVVHAASARHRQSAIGHRPGARGD